MNVILTGWNEDPPVWLLAHPEQVGGGEHELHEGGGWGGADGAGSDCI